MLASPLRTASYDWILGTSLEITWRTTGWRGRLPWPASRRVEAVVLSAIERLRGVFSTTDPGSELSRWLDTVGEEVAVSAEFAEVLSLASMWTKVTGGAFDPSVSPGRGAPAGGAHWEFGDRGEGGARTARRLTTDRLSLDGIAKGYIVDRAAEAAVRGGAASEILVNLGGDLRHLGEGSATISVTDPRRDAENAPPLEWVRISGEGMATSGGYRRGRFVGGRWESHLLDPRTGAPTARIASASVIAATTADADALATALAVLPPEEGLRLADSVPRVGALLLLADGDRIANTTWEARVLRAQAGVEA